MGQGLAHDGTADNRQRRADILADARGHQRQMPNADGVKHHGQPGDHTAADHQQLLDDRHAAHTVVPHAEKQDEQQRHRHHHQNLRRGGHNGIDGQALLDGCIDGEHQRQGDGHIGHAAEAGGAEHDADHHDGNDHKVPPIHLLAEDNGPKGKYHQRLDVVAQAAFQHAAVLHRPQVHQPVAEQQHRCRHLPLEHLLVLEYGPQLRQLSLHLQNTQAGHRCPDNAAGHDEKRVDLAAHIGAHIPVQRLETPDEKAHRHSPHALAVVDRLHTFSLTFLQKSGSFPIYSVQ